MDGSERLAFINSDGKVVISIPSTKEEIYQDLLWDSLSNLKTLQIPTKETYKGWKAVFGGNVPFSWINDNYLKESSIDKLVTF